MDGVLGHHDSALVILGNHAPGAGSIARPVDQQSSATSDTPDYGWCFRQLFTRMNARISTLIMLIEQGFVCSMPLGRLNRSTICLCLSY